MSTTSGDEPGAARREGYPASARTASVRPGEVDAGAGASTPVPPSCSFTVPAHLAAPWMARARVRQWLERHHLPSDLVDDMVYVVSEAVSNAAEHAYPPGTSGGSVEVLAEVLVTSPAGRRVRIVVRDHGKWQPVNPDPGHRGHGIAAMAAVAQELTIRRGDGPDSGTQISVLSPVAPVDGAG